VSANEPARVVIDAVPYEVGAAGLEFERHGREWEVLR
jgi:hypothetical protein